MDSIGIGSIGKARLLLEYKKNVIYFPLTNHSIIQMIFPKVNINILHLPKDTENI